MTALRRVLADSGRMLTFRQPRGMVRDQWLGYFAFGLGVTLLTGIGRYWNNPRAELWQQLGVGSLLYVATLAVLLRLLLLPFRPRNGSLPELLLFLMMTAPPGLLFLVPVEAFLSLRNAQFVNASLLGFVTLWRVALLVWFMRRVVALSGLAMIVTCLALLVFIAGTLTLLNPEHVAVGLLSGIRTDQQSPNDMSYSLLTLLSFSSLFVVPYLLVGYAWAWYRYTRSTSIVQPVRIGADSRTVHTKTRRQHA
ncbi:hypothetical protein HG264_03510 [Pseudomonas sp. gcc21]|uniref:hypothetical protein n=1 Tax=Pseudomonas sp. gcc21 TaxID=2726989 RepID=UPI00145298D0|nr:hypothetical protein [Pseudomonas sp. gcc21]QJD58038.1 hypothetical protein HG264_03510 [Pseudomonas sp. gcc21]